MHRTASRLLTATVAVPLALVLAACAGLPGATAGSAPVTPSSLPSPTAAPHVRVIAVGDSLATGDGYDDTPQDPGSWTMFLGDDVTVAGGWRKDGAATQRMADNLQPVDGDVLVVMGGTNDVKLKVAPETTLRNIERVVAKVDADHVVLCSIPPFKSNSGAVVELNASLEALAKDSGWTWLDPWVHFRIDDEWTPDASMDGVHPTEPVYRSVGQAISEVAARLGR